MKRQSEFSFVQAPVSLVPVAARTEPAIWIERLSIYRELPLSEEVLLRTMTLRRGLNILWAEPGASRGEDQPRSKVSGHATGKTTFCRFIRYLLGDANFGSDTFRNAFREKFPQGWALAEVWVNSQRWLVGRPLGIGPKRFAILDGRIDDLIGQPTLARTGWTEYQQAIKSALFGIKGGPTLPSNESKLSWRMLLQWLTRDQESRYSHLLAWRNPSSQSSSVELNESEKESVIRYALGLASETEQKMLSEFAKHSSNHKSAVSKRSSLDDQLCTDMERLAALLEIKLSLDSPLPEEFVSQKINDIEKKAELLRSKRDEDPKLQKNEQNLRGATAETFAARIRWNDAKADAEALTEEIAIKGGNKKEAERQHKKRDWLPTRGHCSKPLTADVMASCPYAKERPSDTEMDQELRKIGSEADALKFEKALLDQRVMSLFAELNKREEIERELQKQFDKIEKSHLPKTQRASNLAKLADTARILKDNLVQALETKERNEQLIKNLSKQKDRIDNKLDTEKFGHRKRMHEFSELYRFVVKELLGEEIESGVNWSGKSITPFLNYHGRLDSAALETVRLLAFDLTALIDSYIRGDAYHPRFLLHDSPREADLSIDIYHSLFRLIERLETETDSHPPFQYIITTTESPPTELQKEPWLLTPVLRATEGTHRFLGVDL